MIDVPRSVLLLVTREEFTPPAAFGADSAVATDDCLAVAVSSLDTGLTGVALVPEADRSGRVRVGRFALVTEGHVSVRDVYNREYATIGAEPGPCVVTVWGDDDREPREVVFEVRSGLGVPS